ncbi:hypothetical protein ACFU3J_01845 [Streptomyces sp. NPDC057411]|uniref:hypothetical protein n=1 Tax=unclassified Streptomyces TaxID=2593676 RepID=UPI00362B5CEF
MIAIVRTRTLHALRERITEAETATAAARTEAAQHQQSSEHSADFAIRAETALKAQQAALLRATAEAARLEGELETLRAQSLLDTEDRHALRTLLRATRKHNARADHVYVLFRSGELHSVHASSDAAQIAAEAEGAPRDGWTTSTACCTPPVAAGDIPWSIRPMPLGGTR